MQTAANVPRGADARPAISVVDKIGWERQRPEILQALEREIYGKRPANLNIVNTNLGSAPALSFNSTAYVRVENFDVYLGSENTGRSFDLIIVSPKGATESTPIILMQNFCPNSDVIPAPTVPKPDADMFSCSGGKIMSATMQYFFGRYIATPPIEDIMTQGYALGVMYPGDFIPDNSTLARPILDRLFADQDPHTRTSAIMAWADLFSATVTWLENETNFTDFITYGHSRYGKSALVAGALQPGIDGVIAHQSGTGGASLSRDKAGETVTEITQNYPHWFNENYRTFEKRETDIPIDQHHLLALIAPRPILLGNAKRDVWSDPDGAFRAAAGASSIYALYGKSGLTVKSLNSFNPNDDIAFWLRPGTHGVVKEDWPAFLEFLDSHFK